MHLTGQQLEDFDRDGFLILPELFSKDEIAALLVEFRPRAVREQRPVRPHMAPVVEVKVPAEFFVFPYFQAAAMRELGDSALARRVRGRLAGPSRPVTESSLSSLM